jgi:hypothetical protein
MMTVGALLRSLVVRAAAVLRSGDRSLVCLLKSSCCTLGGNRG